MNSLKPRFNVDEVVLLHNMIADSAKYNGEEAIIVAYHGIKIFLRYDAPPIKDHAYAIVTSFKATPTLISEYCLRKKNPPEDSKEITETRRKSVPAISDPDNVDWEEWAQPSELANV